MLEYDEMDRRKPGQYGGMNVTYSDETELWSGRPSQWVNVGMILFWIFFLGLLSYSYWQWKQGNLPYGILYTQELVTYLPYGMYVFYVCALLDTFIRYLRVRQEVTIITRNKILERRGVTRIFRRESYCELSDVTDIQSPPAGLIGVIGLSSLVIHTQDNDQPIIRIRAIRKREDLINKLMPVWREVKVARRGYFGS